MAKRGGPKCGAKLHKREGTCTLPAGWGTSHVGTGNCRKHLGNTANHVKAAETERLEREVRQALGRLEIEPCEDWLTALQLVIGEMLAWKDLWAGKVAELTSVRYRTESGEQLRSEVALYERALDRTERALATAGRLDLDARLVRVSEQTAVKVNQVIRGALLKLGVPVTDEAVRLAIAEQMRLVNEDARPHPPRLALTAERAT